MLSTADRKRSSTIREREIFDEALARSNPTERLAYLDEACCGDQSLRRRLQALLDSHQQTGSILDTPIVDQFLSRSTPESTSSDDTEIELGFLQPSQQSGVIGRMDHYGVIGVLGQGAFGVVLKAFDEKLHRVVAIKVLRPSLAAMTSARRRFLREARSAAAVHHENVVATFSVEDATVPYLVMECVAGRSLQQVLDDIGPLDLLDVLRIGQQIASALAASHATGLIHRDIKPSNILLEDATGRVKITDFGLARTVDDANLTDSRLIAGTPMYMAPEQALRGTVDPRSDLFSLGSVLYAACSGRPPFPAPTTFAVLKRLTEDLPRPIREMIPETPEWFCAILEKLHAKNAADRFDSAAEVADLLGRCESDLRTYGALRTTEGIPHGPASPGTGLDESRHVALWGKVRIRLAVLGAVVCIAVAISALIPVRLGRPTEDAKRREIMTAEAGRWEQGVAGLSPLLQVKAIARRLKELNPGFDGKVTPTITNGMVTGLQFFTDDVDDVSPLRAAPGLKTLEIPSENRGKSKLADLAPLKGLPLTHFDCKGTQVSDLSPLAGMPLERLDCTQTNVSDFSPLRGSKLTSLDCALTKISSLSPLRGLRLRKLECGYNQIADLTPIEGMPIEVLGLTSTDVTDLGPIRGMPLHYLNIAQTGVSDLSPVLGMKLTMVILFGTNVTDLSPIRGMGVHTLHLDYDPDRDDEVVRSLKGLATINLRPANEFWKEQAAIKDWTTRVRAMSTADQETAITARLKELNPSFDEEAESRFGFEDTRLTSLSIQTDHVSDVSFLRAFPGLVDLKLARGKLVGKLIDLAPLRGLPLKQLDLSSNAIVDISPLHGSPLERLSLLGNPVRDLNPLRKAPLRELNLWFTAIDDDGLLALKGVTALQVLNVGGTGITSLAPVSQLKLENLCMNMTKIGDLSPLKGMPLKTLLMDHTLVEDISPVRGMRLQEICITGSPVRDIGVLKGMPLEAVECDFDATRDAAVLRSIPTLKTINRTPTAEFWKSFDAERTRGVAR